MNHKQETAMSRQHISSRNPPVGSNSIWEPCYAPAQSCRTDAAAVIVRSQASL